MLPQIDIENRLCLETADSGNLAETINQLQTLLEESSDQVRVNGTDLRFHTEWEPPLKPLRAWSKEHPECKLTLWADAFAEHHWLLKATIQNGKCDELTVSRIDDEFDAIFQEVYGCSFEAWEQKPREPFSG